MAKEGEAQAIRARVSSALDLMETAVDLGFSDPAALARTIKLGQSVADFLGQHRVAAPCAGPRFVPVGEEYVREPGRGLDWSHTLGRATHEGALRLIAELNGKRHGGFDDWRLPNAVELFGLADRTRYSPAIDPAFKDTKFDYYRTDEVYAPYPDYRWGVSFDNGSSSSLHDGYDHFVRAVRSSQ